MEQEVDGFKEEGLVSENVNDFALQHGLATLAIDGPGVGDSPIKGSVDAERLFEAVLLIGLILRKPWILIESEFKVQFWWLLGC